MDIAPLVPPIMDDPGTASAEKAQDGYTPFDMPICRVGHGVDGRGFSLPLLNAITDSTNYAIQRMQAKPICRIDHPGECEESGMLESAEQHGYISRVWMVEGGKVPVMWATCHLDSVLADATQNGKLPMRSVGVDLRGYTDPQGLLLGPTLEHLAFLGSRGALFPDLDEQTQAVETAAATEQGRTTLATITRSLLKAIGSLPEKMAARFTTIMAAAQAATETDMADPMAPDPAEEKMEADYGQKLLALADILAQAIPLLQECGTYLAGGAPTDAAPDAGPDMPAEGEAVATAARRSGTGASDLRLQADADLASNRVFASLVAGGHATTQHRPDFDLMVKAKGLAATEVHFSSLFVQRPPSPDKDNINSASTAEYEQYRTALLRAGQKPADHDEWEKARSTYDSYFRVPSAN